MIVAVCGGKGGVGKSTIALQLGAAIDGVVVDGDVTMADLPRQEGPDLHAVLSGMAAPHEAIQTVDGVRVVPGGRSLAGAAAADPLTLLDALETLETTEGTVIVDCPAGLQADVGLALLGADRCLLVVTPTKPALAAAIRTRALIGLLDGGLERVIINKASDTVPTEQIERLIGAPAVVVPYDPTIGRCPTTDPPAAIESLATALATGDGDHDNHGVRSW